jgi:hypothetical protein
MFVAFSQSWRGFRAAVSSPRNSTAPTQLVIVTEGGETWLHRGRGAVPHTHDHAREAITDNFGFAAWVKENEEELKKPNLVITTA